MFQHVASGCRDFFAFQLWHFGFFRSFHFIWKDSCGLLGRLYSRKFVQGLDFRPWTSYSLRMLLYLVWKAVVVDLFMNDSWLDFRFCILYRIIMNYIYIVFVKQQHFDFLQVVFSWFLLDLLSCSWPKDQYPVGVPRGYMLSSSLKRNFSTFRCATH